MTGQLLGDHYQLTPDISKLRTPQLAPTEDNILTESQNLLALQHAETPLKGGLNTPLHASQTGATPVHKTMQTPNTMFQTPFRTPHGEVNATPSRTPLAKANALAVVASTDTTGALATNGTIVSASQPVGPTSVRDKLNINPEEALISLEDKAKQVKEREREIRN